MLEVVNKGSHLTYIDAYFTDDNKSVVKNKCDIVHYHNIHDKNNEHVKLTISCLDMWEAEKVQEDKNLIGYINKGLHWHDIMFFKEKGIKSYDWGGVTWNEEEPGLLDGINKFKAFFWWRKNIVLFGNSEHLFKG